MDPASLETLAQTIRRYSLVSIHAAKSGHPGGVLSCADILAVLYGNELGAQDAPESERNRFIMSKGHACPALYAAWAATDLLDPKELTTLRHLDGRLEGHPDVISTPLAETSTGSLGQGMSVACGMALGARHQGWTSRIYALLGDGELQEGEIWEALMFAAHHKLSNLCAIIDYNKLQSDDFNANIMGLEPLADKLAAFGWNVLEIDGHDFAAITGAFDTFRAETEKPTVIVAHTAKGQGVSFMAGKPNWHGSILLTAEDLGRSLVDLGIAESDTAEWINGSIFERIAQ
jgi:transketolase